MEHSELISEQWCSLSGLYTAKEADFMTQLYANSSHLGIQSAFWPPTAHESSILSVQDSKHINEIENNTDLDTCKKDIADKMAQKGREHEVLVSEQERNREKTGKRCRSSNEVPKKKRNVKCKKNMRCSAAAASQDQNQSLSSTCCSDDDDSNNASHQNDSASALKSSGKSRGSATDPQSLYARRRRERINERLRILQNIVPNGTKVDISTMLEEAVQYVKFLQLQIKLLSSDDMWMYAPIAYNGINIGLQLSITPTTKDPKDIHGNMA